MSANELKFEDSPYLKQHVNNPVNWFPWGDKAFKKALSENKLIFLSIGYSTCHWCHVMEKESFEDKQVSEILNDNFISIKVDREEMPEVDKYFQDIHYLLKRRPGGWPLSIVLLPNKKAIFAATYIPKEGRGQMMGFKDILSILDEKYKKTPQKMKETADKIEIAYKNFQNVKFTPIEIKFDIIGKFVKNIDEFFDDENKGIGREPKFPHASTFDVLLDIYSITKDKKALNLARQTLDAMAKGGIYDQIEGGFYRYSVDAKWQIPHFEKMLYTNAELVSAYSKLYDISKDERYKEIVEQTISVINERFYHEGLYFSASDADSQGEEGKYFVFKYDEVEKTLIKEKFSQKEVKEILEYLNISKLGNFEDNKTNPYITSNEIPKNFEKAKEVLKKLRSKVPYPFIDEKILTSWNALFITSLFDAGEKVDKKYLKIAFKSLDILLDTLYKDGILYHQYLFSSTLKVKAILEDYSFLSETLLRAYEISEDKRYLDLAKTFMKIAKQDFCKNGDWYMGYFHSKATLEDNAYKSAMATIMKNMATLSLFTGDLESLEDLSSIIKSNSVKLNDYPHSYPKAIYTWLQKEKKEILLKVPKDKKEESLKEVKKLNYPFLHVLSSDNKNYQACELKACFSSEKSLDIVLEKIKDRIQIF